MFDDAIVTSKVAYAGVADAGNTIMNFKFYFTVVKRFATVKQNLKFIIELPAYATPACASFEVTIAS